MKRWQKIILVCLAMMAVCSMAMTSCNGDPETPGRDAGETWIEADGVHGSASPELGDCYDNATYQGRTGTVCRYSNGDVTVDGILIK